MEEVQLGLCFRLQTALSECQGQPFILQRKGAQGPTAQGEKHHGHWSLSLACPRGRGRCCSLGTVSRRFEGNEGMKMTGGSLTPTAGGSKGHEKEGPLPGREASDTQARGEEWTARSCPLSFLWAKEREPEGASERQACSKDSEPHESERSQVAPLVPG